VLAELAADGIRARPLPGGFAFHSPLMEPVLDRLAQAAAHAAANPPRIGWVSTLTGEQVTEPIGPEYWRRQARQAVRYASAARALQALGCGAFVEVGPGMTLTSLASRDGGGPEVRVASIRPGREERPQMLESAAALYVRGANVDWRRVDGSRQGRRVTLPTYPFQRVRYWWELATRPTPTAAVSTPSRIEPATSFSVAAVSDGVKSADSTGAGRRKELADAAPAERLELLVDYVRERVAVVLRADPGRVLDRGHRLMDMGMDSLMAVELRGALGAGLGLDRQLPATLIFDYPTIEAIARFLEREISGAPAATKTAAGPAAATTVDRDRVHDIAAMSDDDVEALLLKRLESL
jgi:acyl transferase domain-containing protein